LGVLPGGTNSRALGVLSFNPTTTIVGWSEIAGGAHRATSWNLSSSVTMTNLGVLPGDFSSEARSINRNGAVVGFSTTTSAGTVARAARFTAGTANSAVDLNIISSIAQPGTGSNALTGSRAEYISVTGAIAGQVYGGNFASRGPADGRRGFYRSATGVVTR